MQEIRERLQRLERKDWWLWWFTVLVMVLLTVAVATASPAARGTEGDTFTELQVSQAVRGLVGLTLLFITHMTYQRVLIKRLRRQLDEQIAIAAELELRAEVFEKLAIIDPLTGLYNRRFAEQRLAEEMARATRSGQPLSVLWLDLNDFKSINDRYGHTVGDSVLKEFAAHLRTVVRISDTAVRMGGDEFLVLLPELGLEHVGKVVARLPDLNVEVDGQKVPITFAAGWTSYQPGELPQELLDRADRALYAGKRASKDASGLAAELPTEPQRSSGPLNASDRFAREAFDLRTLTVLPG